MANTVEIKIKVDSSQAVAGVQQAQKQFDGFSMVMSQEEQNASRLAKSLDLTGISYQKAGSHAATSLDAVRLLSQEFGFRMPRAIESMLSRMPAVTSILGSTLGVMGAIAGIEIFANAVESAEKLYHEMFDVNAAMREYLDKAGKAAETKFIDEASIETAVSSLESLNTQIDKLDRKRAAAGVDEPLGGARQYLRLGYTDGGMVDYTAAQLPTYTMDDGKERARSAVEQAQNEERANALKRQYAEEELKTRYKLNEAGLQGADLIAQKQKDDLDEAQHRQEWQKQQEQDQANRMQKMLDLQKQMGVTDPEKLTKVPTVDPNAGAQERKHAEEAAAADAKSQRIALAKETNLAIMKSEDARIQSGLQGEALYRQKMLDDIREVTLELRNQGREAEIPARVREINEKYFADLSERAVKAQQELAAMTRAAASAGLTGASRIYADWDTQVSSNNQKYADNPGMLHQANVAAAMDANNKLLELQREFTDRMDAMTDEHTNATLGGYARIEADAAKTAKQIQDDFEKAWGGSGVDQNSAQYIAAAKARESALAAVQQDADAKKRDYTNKMQEETLRYDAAAAEAQRRVRYSGMMGFVADYQNAMDQVRAQDEQHTRELNDQLAKGEIDWDNYTRRVQDVNAETYAQIQAQNQQMQHQIANTLEEAFTNPVEFIKRQMEKMMFEIIASWIMHMKLFQQLFGQQMGSLQPGGAAMGNGGLLGGMLRPAFPGAPQVGASEMAHGTPPFVAPAQRFAATGSMSNSGGGYSAGGGGYTGGNGGGYGGGSAAPESAGSTPFSSAVSDVRTAYGEAKQIGGLLRSQPSAGGLQLPGGQIGTSDTLSSGDIPGVSSPDFGDTGIATIDTPSTGDIGGVSMPDYQAPDATYSGGGMMGALGTAAGGATAAYGLYSNTSSAFESGTLSGTLKGAMGDAVSGAMIGTMIMPGVGTVVGAAIGAAVGLGAGIAGMVTGQGAKHAARDYYKKTLFPEIEQERNSDSADYQTAISQVNRIASDGMAYMSQHWGRDAANWVNENYLLKEQKLADAQIEARAKGGSYAIQMSAAQFHSGGLISGFGSFGTGADEGYIHARLGEAVVNPGAVQMHGPAIDAMNGGASPADIARMYLANASATSSGGVTHNHNYGGTTVHAVDARSFQQMLRGGGAKVIAKELNQYSTRYAGDAISG